MFCEVSWLRSHKFKKSNVKPGDYAETIARITFAQLRFWRTDETVLSAEDKVFSGTDFSSDLKTISFKVAF